jgi:hypothetical protein
MHSKQVTVPPSQHICRNCALVTNVSLSNQRLQLLRDLQNNFFSDMEMFNPTLIFVLNHEEIGIPSGVSSLDPIIDLFCSSIN